MINTNKIKKGAFTLPGESGCEELTLRLADKWGADVIRDSDGTELSDEIVNAGYGIYSTICIIRGHNEWAKQHPECIQQTFLMSKPVIANASDNTDADTNTLKIDLLDGYFKEQFKLNDSEESVERWQVFDRTEDREVSDWSYRDGYVYIENPKPWHRYTVSFMAYRVWEEISMYNHITNNWDKEHLIPIDPIHPEVREYMKKWLSDWCEQHPKTTVVRFTSMFYNFVWIWGDNDRRRDIFTDWGSYDFTVSPRALSEFEKTGDEITAEDFINKGRLNATHMPCGDTKLKWMNFITGFVTDFGRELVDIVHDYGKQAYVFYDDSWVGVEPWGDRFKDFGFDGLIKCVFSGFEARLCAGVTGAMVHELRLHPYLFPVGLGGAPTFKEGGNPTLDAKLYWKNIRRALLRKKIDRIGLGGYLSLTEGFPDFQEYIAKVADEFRMIKDFHDGGTAYTFKPKIAVLTFWGKLRSWTCSGHYHEHPDLDLLNVIEALSGMAFDVDFISFEDISEDNLKGYDVIINAGTKGSAWSGGDKWNNPEVIAALTKWVYEGGVFLGVNQPSAVEDKGTTFAMADVLGIDENTGDKICHGRYSFEVSDDKEICKGLDIKVKEGLYLTSDTTEVLAAEKSMPTVTVNKLGKGAGVYMSAFKHSPENNRVLQNLILDTAGEDMRGEYITDNPYTECCLYKYQGDKDKLVVINNSDMVQETRILTDKDEKSFTLAPFDTVAIEVE